jgi:glutaredoxin
MSLLQRWKRRLPRLFTARSAIRDPQVSVVLYTRCGCHLCDDAQALLAKHRAQFNLAITEVDIDADPQLKARYDCCVPVVEIDGKVRFRGRVNERLLLRLLKAATTNG